MQSIEIKGLTSKEALQLQKKYGMNELVKTEKVNPLRKFIGVFKEPMFLLLAGAAILYFILGQPKEAFIMLFFVSFVASITFIQEWKTENTLNALKNLASPKVTALRDGKKVTIKSSELVPEDIIFLSEGERIPGDCKVLEASGFTVDESTLTGESEPVFKISSEVDISSKEHWKQDMIYAGTLSITGTCIAKVKYTGFNTEYGKIGKAINETKEELSPLQKKTGHLVKTLAIAGFMLCLLVITLSYFYTGKPIESILSGITLAMAIIPEEFPVVLTVFLSLGAYRLAKKNALMRRISAVETLGSATVLCVDKTGTITKNMMEVKSIYGTKSLENIKSFDYNLGSLLVLSCERDPFDPMERALIQAAKQNSIDTDKLYDLDLAHKIPFDSKTKRMANIYEYDGYFYTAAKGSPETILPLCNLSSEDTERISLAIDEMAGRGLRVIAFADCKSNLLNKNLEGCSLSFKGLAGLQDPPKDGVEEAIATCLRAGIRVVMITGDYSKTAVAIGNEIGLKFRDYALTGENIDSMNEDELCNAVKHCDIFSRVIPEHKMKIVKALKRNGEIVAMTGDGVNDAPAIKNADIGIAMGKRGTEVAKEASHMVLMDDNFTTIVHSVEDGRRIFDNIRKAIVYIMIIHIPIAAMALFSPLFNLPQILLPVHIVLLELIIDPTCSIIFEGEEAEPYIMDMPPRSPQQPLFTRNMAFKVLLQGATLFLSAFLPFHYLVDSGFTVNLARSFALMTLIVGNVTLVLVNRSNTQYLFHIFKEKGNTARLLINSLSLVMIFAIVYVPVLQSVCKTSPLNLKMMFFALITGILSTGWWEIVKFFENTFYVRHLRSQGCFRKD